MKTSDIPTSPVLEFLVGLCWPAGSGNAHKRTATWFCPATEFPNSIANAMPAGTPPKIVLSKARNLIKRGWIAGCGCGCRGGFEITADGRATLAKMRTSTLCPHCGKPINPLGGFFVVFDPITCFCASDCVVKFFPKK